MPIGPCPATIESTSAAVSRQVVGIETHGVHGVAPASEHGDLRAEAVGVAGGQHHGRPRASRRASSIADLASTTENHEHIAAAVARVVHGCDYVLR